MAIGAILSGAGSLIGGASGSGGLGGLGESLLGKDSNVTLNREETKLGRAKTIERVKLDEEAIQSIIEEVLGGSSGLASIFAGEQTAGIFDSSVAAQSAGDLASKLIGELARITAERESETISEDSLAATSTQRSESEGLFERFGFAKGPAFHKTLGGITKKAEKL